MQLGGGETELIRGLAKPIGVLATSDTLFVSDQERGQLLKAALNAPASHTVFATLPEPDLLAQGPDGSLLVASKNGSVQKVEPSGAVSTLASGWGSVRGIAYDAERRRLFAAEHAGNGAGASHALHILLLD